MLSRNSRGECMITSLSILRSTLSIAFIASAGDLGLATSHGCQKLSLHLALGPSGDQ